MKLHYDPEVDTAYLRLTAAPILESEEAAPGVVLDFDANGQVVAIEVRGVRQRHPTATPEAIEFELAA